MANKLVREALKTNRVWAWELAEAMGIVDCTLSKWMRRELPIGKQTLMVQEIEKIAKRKNKGEAGNYD